MREIFQANWLSHSGTQILCTQVSIFCDLGNSIFTNADITLDDPEGFQMYMKNSPSGTSKQSILHYGQIIQAGEFIEFETANKDVSGLP